MIMVSQCVRTRQLALFVNLDILELAYRLLIIHLAVRYLVKSEVTL